VVLFRYFITKFQSNPFRFIEREGEDNYLSNLYYLGTELDSLTVQPVIKYFIVMQYSIRYNRTYTLRYFFILNCSNSEESSTNPLVAIATIAKLFGWR